MLQVLLGVSFFYGFWVSAARQGKNRPLWALTGLASFAIPSYLIPFLTQIVAYGKQRNIMGEVMAYQPGIIFGKYVGDELGFGIYFAVIGVGLWVGYLSARAVRKRFLPK